MAGCSNLTHSGQKWCETYEDWMNSFANYDATHLAKQLNPIVFLPNKKTVADAYAFERALRDSLKLRRQEEERAHSYASGSSIDELPNRFMNESSYSSVPSSDGDVKYALTQGASVEDNDSCANAVPFDPECEDEPIG